MQMRISASTIGQWSVTIGHGHIEKPILGLGWLLFHYSDFPDCPSGWTVLSTGCYMFPVLRAPMTWHQGKTYCEAEGGAFVEVNSMTEQQALSNHIERWSSRRFWIGYNDIEREGHWVWTSGASSPVGVVTNQTTRETKDDGTLTAPTFGRLHRDGTTSPATNPAPTATACSQSVSSPPTPQRRLTSSF